MGDHQTRSSWFVGHRWGWGWGDATEDLLQTSAVQNRLSRLPGIRIWSTKRGGGREEKEKSLNFYSTKPFIPGGVINDERKRGRGKTDKNKHKQELCAQKKNKDRVRSGSNVSIEANHPESNQLHPARSTTVKTKGGNYLCRSVFKKKKKKTASRGEDNINNRSTHMGTFTKLSAALSLARQRKKNSYHSAPFVCSFKKNT